MSIRIRPLTEADLEPMAALDAGYAAAHELERVVSLASLRHFERSGHSFVAERESVGGAALVAGFVLAQAVWTGERPTVQGTRLVADSAGAAEARPALAKALVKSSYDSGVYDLLFRAPTTDAELRAALEAEGFREDDHVTLALVLGSRGRAWSEGKGG